MSISFSSTSKNLTPIADRGNSSRSRFLLPNPVRTMMGQNNNDRDSDQHQHLYVLPVLLLEFLALALTRAVLPALLLHEYGHRVYLVMGAADFVRGLLAFFTCPVFGKLSDLIGRRTCLFVTVLGTCAPVCSLALFSWDGGDHRTGLRSTMVDHVVADDTAAMFEDTAGGDTLYLEPSASAASYDDDDDGRPRHHTAITVFIILFAMSGVFSSTFTLVFAYISDTVQNQEERVSAYGLALATFGLSFTLGPIIGGYLAQTDRQYVFLTSLFLALLDLLYIYLILPESSQPSSRRNKNDPNNNDAATNTSVVSILTAADHRNLFSWNPVDVLSIILVDPFLQQVAKVAFLYYTGLWAVISTLSVYAVQRFHLSPERLGELISVLGLSTMVAEAVLVRILVPLLGEKMAMKLGLASFALQCLVLGFAYESWHLFVCAGFSLLGNLVYPSLSSLVSGSVAPDSVGEALGAINGIKALTEGFGPLVFGSLMTISEKSPLPGWPYFLAAVLVVAAYKETSKLPDPDADDEYIHEIERAKQRKASKASSSFILRTFSRRAAAATVKGTNKAAEDDRAIEEEQGLLSEVDEESSDDEVFHDVAR